MSMLKPAGFTTSDPTVVYNRVGACNFPILTCSAYDIFWLLDCKYSV